ncbi:trypsin-7-like isoform X1 [Bombus affinis]|uniref:trypsin-7-like isoform X1 n=1 Tax=Bombus affinis TaxID=309941 RepID=UPI0021B7021A|nr:trypsin-7-like isoform X1 [Bombus affinis]
MISNVATMYALLFLIAFGSPIFCAVSTYGSTDYGKRIVSESARFPEPAESRIIGGEKVAIEEYPFALSDIITYDSTKQPIKLPKTHSMIDDDSLVKVLGWGIFELFGPVSDVLLHSTMRKINNQDCEEASGGDLLTNRMFCALSDTARPCVGDSGSSLIFQGTLFGVVSWSRSCDRQYPTAFTAIAELKDWITDITSIS